MRPRDLMRQSHAHSCEDCYRLLMNAAERPFWEVLGIAWRLWTGRGPRCIRHGGVTHG